MRRLVVITFSMFRPEAGRDFRTGGAQIDSKLNRSRESDVKKAAYAWDLNWVFGNNRVCMFFTRCPELIMSWLKDRPRKSIQMYLSPMWCAYFVLLTREKNVPHASQNTDIDSGVRVLHFRRTKIATLKRHLGVVQQSERKRRKNA